MRIKLLATALIIVFVSVLLIFYLVKFSKTSQQNNLNLEQTQNITEPIKNATPTPSIPPACDKSLWNHVYNPARLQIINQCKTMTGIVENVFAEDDGDYHVLVKPDKEFETLLNDPNNGVLVVELICVTKIVYKNVEPICKGYTNSIQIPKIGAHVKVTGSYVLDLHHGWREIHPVTLIW